MPTASSKLVVDDPFDRAWRRVGLALDRTGFTVVDRDRSTRRVFRPLCRPRCGHGAQGRRRGLPHQAAVLEDGREGQARAVPDQVVETAPHSVVSVQDPSGSPDRTQASEKILALLKDQLK